MLPHFDNPTFYEQYRQNSAYFHSKYNLTQMSLVDQYVLGAKNFYPNLSFGMQRGTSIDDVSKGEQFDFYSHQQVLKGTEYFAGKSRKFIHYTSLDVLFNILNTKETRLYNLKSLNDGQELSYAIHQLGLTISDAQVEHFKNSLFLHSFCEYNNDDDFNMWRLYGKDGSGVGIVYEIPNIEDKWYQCFLGKVVYGTSSQSGKLLKSFIEYHNSFVKDNPTFIDNIPSMIATFLLFHKNEIWSVEKEHRLFTYLSYDQDFLDIQGLNSNFYFENYLCHSVGTNRKENAYLRCPLLPFAVGDFSKYRDANEEKFFKTIPHLGISEVVLGYNYSEKEYQEIGYLIYRLSSKVFGKHILTKLSKLSAFK